MSFFKHEDSSDDKKTPGQAAYHEQTGHVPHHCKWRSLTHPSFSFASQDTDRSYVSSTSIQPLAIWHFDGGWYAGLPDVPHTYDFKTEHWTTAFGARVGIVMKFGNQSMSLFGQATYNSEGHENEISPEWTYKVNLTFLFPG